MNAFLGRVILVISLSSHWSEVKVTQSSLTLCNPMDYTVPGIFQTRKLERVAFPFSRGSSQPRNQAQVITLNINISSHPLLACRISAEKLADNLMRIPLYVIYLFPWFLLMFFSLYLIFVNLINTHLSMLLLVFILYGTLYAAWTWLTVSFSMLGNFSTISSVQSLSHVWLFVTPWTLAHQASLFIANSWSLLKLIDVTQPSHPLSPPSPPAFNLSQHQGFFQWVSSSHQVAKVLEFQL